MRAHVIKLATLMRQTVELNSLANNAEARAANFYWEAHDMVMMFSVEVDLAKVESPRYAGALVTLHMRYSNDEDKWTDWNLIAALPVPSGTGECRATIHPVEFYLPSQSVQVKLTNNTGVPFAYEGNRALVDLYGIEFR